MMLPSFLRTSRCSSFRSSWTWYILSAFVMLTVICAQIFPAQAEGSRDLYPPGGMGNRGNLEWRTNLYGNLIHRRTLLQVFAKAGEVILVGSSAVGVPSGPIPAPPAPPPPVLSDILIFTPGQVTGPVGNEIIPGAAAFSCNAQRALNPGVPTMGQILSRAEEVAGPDTVPGGGNPGGYVPCFFAAPTTGIYNVVMSGPAGSMSGANGQPTGNFDIGTPATKAKNFDDRQGTSVAAWDVTVRANLASPVDIKGRLFSRYMAMLTGGNSEPVFSTLFALTPDGYRHQIDLRGLDGLGFVTYANTVGFFDSDGTTPLYRDVLFTDNNLTAIDGNVKLAIPEYPLFFNNPTDPAVLTALGIPNAPVLPSLTVFNFTGTLGGNKSSYGTGGTFNFTTVGGVITQIVISGDAISPTPNFDPTLPTNRVLRVVTTPGPHTLVWNGLDNAGNPFPVSPSLAQPYRVQAIVHGGESHFPLLDAENSMSGGPSFTLLNPPAGLYPPPSCPPWTGGCSGAFYDDRGYRTASGTTVWPVNTILCGQGAPPVANSNTIIGYDSQSAQRAYGIPVGPNTGNDCSNPSHINPAPPVGGFGDAKGLDVWTYYPSLPGATGLLILKTTPPPPPPPPPPGMLTFTKVADRQTAKPGDPITFTLTATNGGGTPVTQAVVNDPVPNMFIVQSASSTQGTSTVSGNNVTFTLGTINPGQTVTMKINTIIQPSLW